MTPFGTIRIKRENISDHILDQIAENLFEDLYLVFDTDHSLNLSRKTKDQVYFEIVTKNLSQSVLQQPDFSKFYAAIVQNIRGNLDYLIHVKKTSLLPPLYKIEMIIHLILDQLDHESLFASQDEDLDDDTLSQYDDVISLYGEVPDIDDFIGRELRIQLHLIKNSELHFADPEKKAELLEELLMQSDTDEFRQFFIIDSLHKAMNISEQDKIL